MMDKYIFAAFHSQEPDGKAGAWLKLTCYAFVMDLELGSRLTILLKKTALPALSMISEGGILVHLSVQYISSRIMFVLP